MVDRIRLILQARGLSPTQFADVVGVARPVISHVLSGRNKPSLEVVQKILAAFPDLSMAWLLNGNGSMVVDAPAPAAEAAYMPAAASSIVTGAPIAAMPAPTAPTAPQIPLVTPTTVSSQPSVNPLASGNGSSSAAIPHTEGSRTAGTAETMPPSAPVAAQPSAVPPPMAARAGTPAPRKFVRGAAPATARFTAPSWPVAVPNKPESAVHVEPAPLPTVPAMPVEPPATISSTTPPTLAPLDAALAFAEPGKAIRRIVIFYRDGSFADYQPE